MAAPQISRVGRRDLLAAILSAHDRVDRLTDLTDSQLERIPVETYVDFNGVERTVASIREAVDIEKKRAREADAAGHRDAVKRALTEAFGPVFISHFSFDPHNINGFYTVKYVLQFRRENAPEVPDTDNAKDVIIGEMHYQVRPGVLGGVEFCEDGASVLNVSGSVMAFLKSRQGELDVYDFFAQLHRAMQIPEGALELKTVRKPQTKYL